MMITTQTFRRRPMAFTQPSRTLPTASLTTLRSPHLIKSYNIPALHLVGLCIRHLTHRNACSSDNLLFSFSSFPPMLLPSPQANSRRQISYIISSKLQACSSKISASCPPTKDPCTPPPRNTLPLPFLGRRLPPNPLICTTPCPHPFPDQTPRRTAYTTTTIVTLGTAALPIPLPPLVAAAV